MLNKSSGYVLDGLKQGSSQGVIKLIMTFKTPRRTLKEAVDLDTMQKITSDDLLNGGLDYRQGIRIEASRRHENKNDRYACARCGESVYVSCRTRKPLWKHYQSIPASQCDWWTGKPLSVDRVCAQQFQGQQESPLHYKLKHQIADLLRDDQQVRDVQIETRITGENGFRKPDVNAFFEDKRIAFEIQLAHTQLPIIINRETFYKNENVFLLWLTWNFDQQALEHIPQTFKDVYTCHHKNLFSVDEETLVQSAYRKTFLIRAHVYSDEGWQNKIMALGDLIWPETGLPYGFTLPSALDNFRAKWLEKVSPEGMDPQDVKALIDELMYPEQLEKYGWELMDVARLINCLLTLQTENIYGTKEPNLKAYSNTFLSAESRKKYVTVFKWAAVKCRKEHLFQEKSIRKKIVEAQRVPQLNKSDFEMDIIHRMFKDWIGKERLFG